MSNEQTIVIGGGLAGVAVYYELLKRGRSALLLEARSELASGTSFANGGVLTPSLPDPWNSPGVGKYLIRSLISESSSIQLRPHAVPGLFFWGLQFLRNSTPARFRRATASNYKLASFSVAETQRVLEEDSIEFDLQRGGTLKIFDTEITFKEQRRLLSKLEPFGLRFSALNCEEIADKEPLLGEIKSKLAGGFYFPDDRSGDACAFTRALGDRGIELGGEVRTNERVQRIVVDGSNVVGVETDRTRYSARNVVVAAGIATPRLTKPLGVRVPIAPAKGYSLTINMKGWNSRPTAAVIDGSTHFGAIPLGEKLRCVAIAEFSGDDDQVDQNRIAYLYRQLKNLYPGLSDLVDGKYTEEWAGLRPMSADGVPFIGEAGPNGLWVNAGHSHLGWTMAMGSAVLLVDLMTANSPKLDPYPYRVKR